MLLWFWTPSSSRLLHSCPPLQRTGKSSQESQAKGRKGEEEEEVHFGKTDGGDGLSF